MEIIYNFIFLLYVIILIYKFINNNLLVIIFTEKMKLF